MNPLLIGFGLMFITLIAAFFIPKIRHCGRRRSAQKVIALLLFAMAANSNAAEKSILESISVAPVAALKGSEITGEHTFGAGLDLGFDVNKFVSIHATALGYETDNWRGGVVDESEVYGKANFVKFANESFVFYGKGGATRDWSGDDWALGVGLGAELRLSKSVSVGADYTINAWFEETKKSSLARALVSFHF